MSMEERFLFHARLASYILAAYADERHRIADDDPDREEKRAKNKADCIKDVKKLNRYFFGAKQLWACEGCPFMDYFALNEAEKMANSTDREEVKTYV